MATSSSSPFWLLRPPAAQRFAVDAPDIKYERIICPAHHGHRRAGRPLGCLSIVAAPSAIKDFTWSWSSDILISQNVRDLFERHGVTGWVALPATVKYDKASDLRPPDLLELVLTGRGGLGGPEAGVQLVKSCPACGYKRYSIAEPSQLIDPAAWDRSDLFIVWPLPRYRFVSDRLADIIRQARITGVKLIPASEIPIKHGDQVSPGRLTSAMPAGRARELSEAFGIS